MSKLMQFFKFDHLPPHLQAVSGEVYALACKMDAILPDGAEKTAGLRKLLEAKDCFVRAVLELPTTTLRQETEDAAKAGYGS